MNVTVQAPPPYKVVVSSHTYTVNVNAPAPYLVTLTGVNTYKLKLTQTILQGPKGEKGDPGESGSGGDKHYAHDQMIAASTWTVTHNLNKYPSVTVVNSAGDEVEAEIAYTSVNTVEINFNAANAGKAYLN